ncbi:MAG TPA: hypothetical protein VKB93_15505, partial [Thermoanaerobaculia bacterium]|nr:hypothetical protein [Thermoanaerobaculia bacterium]
MRHFTAVLTAVLAVFTTAVASAQTCTPVTPLFDAPATVCPNAPGWAAARPPATQWAWSSYAWTVTNATLVGPANEQYVNFTASQPGTVTLSLTVTDNQGCSFSESRNVQISPTGVPVDIHSNRRVCPNGLQTVAAYSNVPNATYQWSISNGELVSANGAYAQIRAGASGAVTLTAVAMSPDGSCSGSGTFDLPIIPAELSVYTPYTGMCANAVADTAAFSPEPIFDSWSWTIENGQITSNPNAQYIQFQSGAAGEVRLTVTASSSSVGCTSTATTTVQVSDPPLPQVTAPQGPLCSNALTEATVTNAADYANVFWTVYNGSIEEYNYASPVIRFRPNGFSDSVTLVASGYSNGCMRQTTVEIPVVNSLAYVSPGSQTICPGSSITLTAPEAASYSWSTGATTRSITVSAAGFYTANVVYANGCTASGSVQITTHSTTTPTISASGPTTFCEGGSVTLTSSPAPSYLWSNGATTQSIDVTASGNYTVTTTNANGCATTSAPAAVTVHDAVGVAWVNIPQICHGVETPAQTQAFRNGLYVEDVTYNWTISGGTITSNNGKNITFVSTEPSVTLSVTVTDANGCSASKSRTEAVPAQVTASITPSGPTTFCEGGSVTLTANDGYSYYAWSTGEFGSSITVSEAGEYRVTVSDPNGCSVTSEPVTVTVNAVPEATTITPSGATTFCEGGSVTLTAPASASYLWSNGATTQSIVVTATGTFDVTVTNASGCSSAKSPAVAVTVNPNPATPAISASGPTTFCQGGSVTLTAPASASYLWSNGATTQSIVVTATGNF